jgi:hypothetical protein
MTSDPNRRHDVVTFQIKKLKIIPPLCKLHQNLGCEMFCENCNRAVCQTCLVSGLHEQHQIFEITKIHSDRKQWIKRDTVELETRIAPELKSIISEMEKILSSVVQSHDKRQQTITEFGNKCHTLIDSVINKYLSESKKMETEDKDSLQTVKSEFEELESSIQSTIDENRSILASRDFSKLTSLRDCELFPVDLS